MKYTILAVVVALCWNFAMAQSNGVVYTIESNHLEINAHIGESRFWGSVVFESPSYVLHADSLVVSAVKNAAGRQELQRLHAWDNVELYYGDKRGFSDTLYYYHDRQTIVLEGNARLIDSRSSLAAPRITIHEPTGEAFVEGDESERVKVIFEDDRAD